MFLRCVCACVCNHCQLRTSSKTPHLEWGQHYKRGRSAICGYVQTVANCLLLHVGVCWRKRKEGKKCAHGWSSVERWKIIHKLCVHNFTKCPQLPVVHCTHASWFSKSNIIVLDLHDLQVCVCVCVCVALQWNLMNQEIPENECSRKVQYWLNYWFIVFCCVSS